LRRGLAEFITRVGQKLNLSALPLSVAIFLAQHFFLARSLQRNDRFVVACACVFLGSKQEEHHKNLHDVIHSAYQTRHHGDAKAMRRIKEDKNLYEDIRDNVLMAERCLLYMMGFGFHIDTPQVCLLGALNDLGLAGGAATEDDRNRFLFQLAWNLCNDCMRTTLCLQFHPKHLGHASLYMASKIAEMPLPSGPGGMPWFVQRGTSAGVIDAIVRQLLECFEDGEAKDKLNASST